MRKTRNIFGLLALLLCAPSLSGAADATGEADNVLRATLDNGLRVIIVRDTLAPVVSTVINYRAGSNETPEGFPGMAHAEEHMMFRGSAGLSASQLANISATMGGQFNADTQQTVTQYFFTVPAEDLDIALQIESIRMRGILADDKLWDNERGAINQEVAQDLSNPQYVFYTKLLEALFKGTPYAHDALGTRPSFDQTTGTMLKQFHDTWYAPNNAILVIVGDVRPGEALAKVKALFGELPAKELPARPEVRLEPVQPETLNLDTDQPQGMAVLSFRIPGSDDPDYAATQVLADVLSSQRGNLYALVPEGKALFAGFSANAFPKTGVGYAAAGFPAGADAPALVQEVRKILANELKNGVAADLVEAAKRHERADAEQQKNSVSGLAMAWSEAVAVEGRESPEDDVRAIERVSVDDVNRVARKYLDLDHAVVAILTPQQSGAPTSPKGFGGTESFAPQETQQVELPDWAKKALGRLSVPESAVHPLVTTLRNGLKLIVQPESISDTVSVYGQVRHNPLLQVPRGKEGTTEVLGRLFSHGTTSLDRLAFQKALDDIGANESAGTQFSVQVLSDHFERAVELLADNELHPALPEQAFTVIRPQLAASVAGRLKSPGYLMGRALSAALFPKNDPTLRQATPATVSALKIQDIRRYYEKVLRPDLTTIVVIGHVTPEQARMVIEKYFGSWKAKGPKPNTTLPAVPLNKPSTVAVPDTSRVQDKVTLGETLGLNRFNPDYYALELGNHVLGGAFYATRLYRDLRQDSGLVYSVSSSFHLDETRGLYIAGYACDPPNVSKARAIIVRNLKSMRTTPVTDDELRQAQALLLREIPLSESSQDSIAQGLLSRATLDLPLDEPTRAAQRYVKLTAKQVQAAFVKWLRPRDLVEITQGPPPR
ncbi:MAG: M16 family metallopeptidase [Candidatus Binatia bacterium]